MKNVMQIAWNLYRGQNVPRIRLPGGKSKSLWREVFARCLRMAWAQVRPQPKAGPDFEAWDRKCLATDGRI